jgi:alpha-mannosidase
MNNKLEKIIGILVNRYEELAGYVSEERSFKFFKGKSRKNPAYKEFDDSNWEDIKLPYEWNNTEDIWFRKKIVVPSNIDGVDINRSRIEMCGEGYMSGNAIVLGHGELYIDGKKIFEEKNWTDFRYRNLISKNALEGDEHVITIHFFKRSKYIDACPRKLNLIEIHYSNVDDIIFELGSFIEEIKFAQFLDGGLIAVEEAFGNISPEYILNVDLKGLLITINDIRNKLSSLKKFAKKYLIHLVGHAHIDMNWLWPMDETVDICKSTFKTVIKLMDKFKDFTYSQSQAYIYRLIEEKNHKLLKKIEKRVKEGRWEMTASSWVEPDLNMSNGESIVRQILYAKKYVNKEFNIETNVFWSPDTFGHPWTIPQILKKSDINYYFFMRASKKDYDLFWWEGPDGSRVLAFNSKYMAQPAPGDFIELVKFANNKQGVDESMYVYGIGDHGGGPTAEDIKTINKLNDKALMPDLKFSTSYNYFNAIYNKKDAKIPVVCDEFNPIFDGCYTTHWDAKVHNRTCERLALQAESASAVCRVLNLNSQDLKEVWEITLFNQFHDILDGSGVRPAYDYSNSQAEKAEKIAEHKLCNCIGEISKKISTKKEGVPIIVFNSLSWDRNDIVNISLREDMPKSIIIKDDAGNIYPSQIMDGKVIFVARDVPSLGYRVYYICEGEYKHNSGEVKFSDPLRMENEFFILEIDKDTGTISFLYDKENARFIMKKRRDEGTESENTFPLKTKTSKLSNAWPATAYIFNNMLQLLYEEPHCWSAWVIGNTKTIENLIKESEIKVISEGPVAAVIRVKNKFMKSFIAQDITLYREIERIDINNYLKWGEKSEQDTLYPMLKASFTPILETTKANFSIPFGNIERVPDGREFPALNWVDISDNKYGLSILTDTKYGFNVKGNTICITLARTSNDPDPDPDRGNHEFTYSIYPHKGDFKKADTVRKGYELNNKLIAYYIEKGKDGDGTLAESKSFISIDSPNVILTCFKKAEDSNNLIIRVYESKGNKVEATVKFGFNFRGIEEVNLIEKTIESNISIFKNSAFSFFISPYEIKTFKIII